MVIVTGDVVKVTRVSRELGLKLKEELISYLMRNHLHMVSKGSHRDLTESDGMPPTHPTYRLTISWIVPNEALMIEYGATEDAQMEEYLENVKRLRSQMNDIEEAAANRSVEEQKQKTAIVALETDISSVKAETKRLNDEAEEMLKAKANIGSEITEKQRKLSLLEAESCSLSQVINLPQNLDTNGMGSAEEEIFLDKENKNAAHWMQMSSENMGDENTERCGDLDLKSAKMKLDELEIKKLQIIEDRVKTQQLLEQMNSKMQSTPSALMEMAVKALENEYSSVKADKAGELEYLQSLEARIDQLKNLSYIINCQCGNEYKVELAN
ncbi:hypothetical protein ZIOFF_040497 [Zingiber officinale]|uniref:Uncharacterized protein n=1 Tax=Zingiber officinale TaxID=94328 RepID=A0A8J5KY17_ZINOF|nr:hypothetical protein ZIOFF_040497 [Zingiber officinale]